MARVLSEVEVTLAGSPSLSFPHSSHSITCPYLTFCLLPPLSPPPLPLSQFQDSFDWWQGLKVRPGFWLWNQAASHALNCSFTHCSVRWMICKCIYVLWQTIMQTQRTLYSVHIKKEKGTNIRNLRITAICCSQPKVIRPIQNLPAELAAALHGFPIWTRVLVYHQLGCCHVLLRSEHCVRCSSCCNQFSL